jgi:hypothetical protein
VELMFLHPVGFVGHVLYSSASVARNVAHHFSWSAGLGVVSIKSALST